MRNFVSLPEAQEAARFSCLCGVNATAKSTPPSVIIRGGRCLNALAVLAQINFAIANDAAQPAASSGEEAI